MRSTSGITCCHFFCSAVFSMPVCRKPTVGDTDTTVSPSSSSTSRSTPCVLGCCGPMFTVITSLRSSGIVASALASREAVLLEVGAELVLGHLQRLGDARRHPDLHRVVLAQRVALPVLGHQQTAKVWMA